MRALFFIFATVWLSSCAKDTSVKVTPDAPTPLTIEQSFPGGAPRFQVDASLTPARRGADRYVLKLSWPDPATPCCLVFRLVDGHVVNGRITSSAGTPARFDLTPIRLEWGHVHEIEIRAWKESAGDLLFDLKYESARQSVPLFRKIRIDLTGSPL